MASEVQLFLKQERAMCPMCIGTATIILSGGGTTGGAALALGYWARKKRLLRAIKMRLTGVLPHALVIQFESSKARRHSR